MNVADILPKQAVLPELKAGNRRDLLSELAGSLTALEPGLAVEEIVRVLLEREELGSTAMGDGVAIPHGKIAGLGALRMAVGRSAEGIDFNAPDNRPCRLFFLILAPDSGAGQHLRLLAQLARRLKDPLFRSDMYLAADREQLWQAVTAP